MMDGYVPVPDGTRVNTFVLMPEAGQLMHPAHRDSDEMVEIRLTPGAAVPYLDRSLTWAAGYLRPVAGKVKQGRAAWVLAEASIHKAEQRDIARWFTP